MPAWLVRFIAIYFLSSWPSFSAQCQPGSFFSWVTNFNNVLCHRNCHNLWSEADSACYLSGENPTSTCLAREILPDAQSQPVACPKFHSWGFFPSADWLLRLTREHDQIHRCSLMEGLGSAAAKSQIKVTLGRIFFSESIQWCHSGSNTWPMRNCWPFWCESECLNASNIIYVVN